MPIKVDHTFDKKNYRHYMNGINSVLHCHHYMALTTRLAEQTADFGGPRILKETAEDSLRPLLDETIKRSGLSTPEEKLEAGKELYSIMGLGSMEIKGDESGGEVKLLHSHVDEGWIKKWGKHDKFVNHVTCGYLAAVFAAAYGKPARSYQATEQTSIVVGDDFSILAVKAA
ncbi:MAG: hypothetical protein ACOC1F_09080 [Myxococcota bacterium]